MSSSILAIDPGPQRSSFVVWDGREVIRFGEMENDALRNLLKQSICLTSVCEMVQSFGMPVGADVFETVFWIGRFAEAHESSGGRYFKIYRSDVKHHLCHSPWAKDSNIRQALIDRFGPPGTKKAPGILYGVNKHVWSALAVAVTWLDNQSSLPARPESVTSASC